MATGNFFRGTTHQQDSRFADKERKLLLKGKWPPIYSQAVDLNKVELNAIRQWVEQKTLEYIGTEDEVIVEMIIAPMEDAKLNNKENPIEPKVLEINLTGFFEENVRKFVEEFWELMVSAQESPGGIPQKIIESRLEDINKRQEMLQGGQSFVSQGTGFSGAGGFTTGGFSDRPDGATRRFTRRRSISSDDLSDRGGNRSRRHKRSRSRSGRRYRSRRRSPSDSYNRHHRGRRGGRDRRRNYSSGSESSDYEHSRRRDHRRGRPSRRYRSSSREDRKPRRNRDDSQSRRRRRDRSESSERRVRKNRRDNSRHRSSSRRSSRKRGSVERKQRESSSSMSRSPSVHSPKSKILEDEDIAKKKARALEAAKKIRKADQN